MGKAKGRGAFIGVFSYDAMSDVGEMLQCAVCCVCCMMIIGPILLLAGVSMIGSAASDAADPSSDKYLQSAINQKAINEAWTSVGRQAFIGENRDTGYSLNVSYGSRNVNLSLGTQYDPRGAELRAQTNPKYQIGTWKAAYYTGTLSAVSKASNSTSARQVVVNNKVIGTTAPCTTRKATITCTCRRSSSNRNSNYNNGKNYYSNSGSNSGSYCSGGGTRTSGSNSGASCLTSQCQSLGGTLLSSGQTSSSGWSSWNSANSQSRSIQGKGVCDITQVLTSMVITATPPGVGTSWSYQSDVSYMYTARRAASASGCSSGSTQIKVDVRSKTDPWQNLNKNKFDFGSTPGEKAAAGATLAGIGGVMTAIPLLSCYFIYKCLSDKQSARHTRPVQMDQQQSFDVVTAPLVQQQAHVVVVPQQAQVTVVAQAQPVFAHATVM